MLALLLDEQISFVVAEQVRAKRPEIPIESVRDWRGGALVGAADEALLRGAAAEQRTLVTYDQKTIPPLLSAWAATGEEHGGVLFVDNRTIAPSDIGALVLALIEQWDEGSGWDWTNRIWFVRRAR